MLELEIREVADQLQNVGCVLVRTHRLRRPDAARACKHAPYVTDLPATLPGAVSPRLLSVVCDDRQKLAATPASISATAHTDS